MIKNGKYRHYISFSNTVLDDKLRYLYLNKINNIDKRFETLNNVNANGNNIMNKE